MSSFLYKLLAIPKLPFTLVLFHKWRGFLSIGCDLCPAKKESLARYPGVLAPVSGSRTVTAECADNSHITFYSSLIVNCSSNGTWSGVPQCQCNTGYNAVTVTPEKKICKGWYILIQPSHYFAYTFVYTAIKRKTCGAKNDGLIRFPTTLAPIRGSVTVFTQCADNAHRTSSSMRVTCSSSGRWSGSPQCECDEGYRGVTVAGRQSCAGNQLSIQTI